MKSEILSEYIGMVDESLVLESAQIYKKNKFYNKSRFKIFSACAAVILIFISVSCAFLVNKATNNIGIVESKSMDITIEYVKNNEIQQETIYMESDIGKVFNKWVEVNDISMDIELLSVRVNDSYDYDIQLELPEGYALEVSNQKITLQLVISSDFEELIQGENGDLYLETFNKTIQNLLDNEQIRFEEWQRNSDRE